jgi:hypothetical protein
MINLACAHPQLVMGMEGKPFIDSNMVLMRMGFKCSCCGQRFRATGVHGGMSFDAPSTPDDGETIIFPLVPVGEDVQTEVVGTC